jgi:hypothetical protein
LAPEVTVACVYRRGGNFTDDYPRRLRDAVAQHCKAPHDFVCLSNVPNLGVETRPLLRNWPGWWSKLELFREGLFRGRVVYFDLDTMIFRDITDIVTYPHEFSCITNWKTQNGDGKVIGSAIMGWNSALDLGHIFNDFTLKEVDKYEQNWVRWGDQGWIQDNLNRPFESLQKLFPNRIVHYKTHVRGPTKESPGKVPPGASVVCFSGKPRPHEINWSIPLGN